MYMPFDYDTQTSIYIIYKRKVDAMNLLSLAREYKLDTPF